MATTYVDYTATAAQTDFAFNFPYLEDEHVKVEINGVATTDFTIVTSPSTKIVLDTGASAGEIVRVQRVSAPDENLVDFQNGSVLTESELDRAYLHNRYLAEESAEQNDVSMRLTAGATGSFNALNKKIVNVSDPTADQDAATKNYVDDTVAGVALGTLPDGSITAAKLDTDAVTTVKIEDGAVTTVKIEDGAVTSAKISTTDTNFNVQSDGKVGLGTASPESSLHIYAETNRLEDTTLLTIENYSDDLKTNGSFISFKFTDDNANEDPQVQIGAIVGQNADATSSISEGAGAFVVKTNNPSGDGTTLPGDATQLQERLRVDYAGNVGIGITNPAHALDVAGDVNVSLGNTFKINGANFLLDEDTMSSNSDTQGATQQSIKAYVDTQVGLGISKWDSGWVDQDDQTTPISVGSGATMIFDHDLGSAALGSVFSVYAAEDVNGTNMCSQNVDFWETTAGTDINRGLQIQNITSTNITVQLAEYALNPLNTSGGGLGSNKPWGTGTGEFSHIRLVLVG